MSGKQPAAYDDMLTGRSSSSSSSMGSVGGTNDKQPFHLNLGTPYKPNNFTSRLNGNNSHVTGTSGSSSSSSSGLSNIQNNTSAPMSAASMAVHGDKSLSVNEFNKGLACGEFFKNFDGPFFKNSSNTNKINRKEAPDNHNTRTHSNHNGQKKNINFGRIKKFYKNQKKEMKQKKDSEEKKGPEDQKVDVNNGVKLLKAPSETKAAANEHVEATNKFENDARVKQFLLKGLKDMK